MNRTEDVINAVEGNPVLNSPAIKRLLIGCTALGLGEIHITQQTLAAINAYADSLPSHLSRQDKALFLASFVGYLKSEVHGRLRGAMATPAGQHPPGYAALANIMNQALVAWESGDREVLNAIAGGYATAFNGHSTGGPLRSSQWPLRVSPKWYLSRYPDGEYVELAEKLLRGKEPDEPDEPDEGDG